MLYTQDRTEQRQFLANAWQKLLNKQALNPLENQLIKIIALHPEYHALIQDVKSDYFVEQGEVNPFLHINLHLALTQQLSISQPAGIQDYYQKTLNKIKNPHEAQHRIMDCIAQMIFTAQKSNASMNPQAYIECLKLQCR